MASAEIVRRIFTIVSSETQLPWYRAFHRNLRQLLLHAQQMALEPRDILTPDGFDALWAVATAVFDRRAPTLGERLKGISKPEQGRLGHGSHQFWVSNLPGLLTAEWALIESHVLEHREAAKQAQTNQPKNV